MKIKRTSHRGFEQTRWSLVLRAGRDATQESRRALAELCAVYRPPLYVYVCRFVKDPVRAEDFVQDFMTRLVAQDVLRAADPTRGRFRAFLKTSIKNHVRNAIEADRALKRGGESFFVDIQDMDVAATGLSPEQLYDRECARQLVQRALARLREDQERKGHGVRFEALRERIVGEDERATLQADAERLGQQTATLRVALSRLRKSLGDMLRDEVAQTISCPEELDDELRELLAALKDPS